MANKSIMLAQQVGLGRANNARPILKRYEVRMTRILFIFGLLLPLSGDAKSPATLMDIEPENIDHLGFKIEITQFDDRNSVYLIAPLLIDDYWVPVGTQTYTYTEQQPDFPTQVGLGNPTEEVSIYSHYKPAEQDLMVGFYYKCKLDRPPCRGDWDSRLYLIQSVNQYLITSKGKTTP